MSERGSGQKSAADWLLTEAQCVALAEQIFGLQQGGGETLVQISSNWDGGLRWGRNRVTLASDVHRTGVQVTRAIHKGRGTVKTNQLDPASLQAAVRAAERLARYEMASNNLGQLPFTTEYPKPAIWSDATYDMVAEDRGRVARALIEPVEAHGMLSAGDLGAAAEAYAVMTSQGQRLYARMTQGRCAMTVRDPQGTGSGWAGKTSYDWNKIDGPALADRALRKCLDSRNPVALEPGRYTVILEPQAVADLLGHSFARESAEGLTQGSPWWLRPGFAKLGLKVADERVTIGQDPLDPELGTLPFAGSNYNEPGDPYRAVNWIDKGVLTALAYGRAPYALSQLNDNLGLINSGAFRMAGGETSIEEMIATTKRGLLVTRLWGVQRLNPVSLLSTGLTRDGLWLIENGKIIKPVKNFRFTDSPLFVLNSLEQLGPAEPVFGLWHPVVVPPLKARDFNFTALIDSV